MHVSLTRYGRLCGMKPKLAMWISVLGFAAAVVGANPTPVAAEEVPIALAAYKAVYRITLETARHESAVVGANGKMIHRFYRNCDAWLTQAATVLDLHYDDDSHGQLFWKHGAWESFKGDRFRSIVSETHADGGEHQIKASVQLPQRGSAGVARYSAPKEFETPLPVGTLFPVGHFKEVLAAAQEGRSQISSVLFDGTSEDNPFDVHAAILGPASPAEVAATNRKFGLTPVPAWRIQMVFVPRMDSAGVPDYEVEATYREDGIATKIIQDFGSFSVRIALKELEKLAGPECR